MSTTESDIEWPFPPLTQSDLEVVKSTLPTDGQFSSDGEFSEIAKQEIAQLNGTALNVDNIKMEGVPYNQPDVQTFSGVFTPNKNVEKPCPMSHDSVSIFQEIPQEDPFLNQYSTCSTFDPMTSNSATSRDPSTQIFPGELGFQFRVPPALKSKDAQFSEHLGKLYINQNKAVQIMFQVRPEESVPLPANLTVRAVVIFTRPDDFHYPVTVCHTHSRDSDGKLKNQYAEHLMRCLNEQRTRYFQDPVSGRHSVLTQITEPDAGSNEVCLSYKFMDLGSCSGGLNRRDTAVIFTLEFEGTIIGRQVMGLRICTCPKRDMAADERSEKRTISSVQTNLNVPNGKIKSEKPQEEFWVLARGEENYKALKKVGLILDKAIGGTPDEYEEALERINNPKKKPLKKKRKLDDTEIKEENEKPSA